MIETLEARLDGRDWMLGANFSAADVMVGSTANFMKMFNIMPDSDAIAAYIERCLARPAHRRALEIDAEAAPLPGRVDGDVRQVAAPREVGDGARDADQVVAVPRGDEDVGVEHHRRETGAVRDRPRCRKPGSVQQRDELVRVDWLVVGIGDVHAPPPIAASRTAAAQFLDCH